MLPRLRRHGAARPFQETNMGLGATLGPSESSIMSCTFLTSLSSGALSFSPLAQRLALRPQPTAVQG